MSTHLDHKKNPKIVDISSKKRTALKLTTHRIINLIHTRHDLHNVNYIHSCIL